MGGDKETYIDRMRQLDTGDLGNLSIELPLEGANLGRIFTADLPGSLIWAVYDTFQKLGRIQGLAILMIDQAIRAELQQQDISNANEALNTIWLKLGRLLSPDKEVADEKPTPDAVLAFTYRLLREKVLTYTQAANIARILLEDENITAEAWRRRVARFAKAKEWDPVQAQRGRPKKADE